MNPPEIKDGAPTLLTMAQVMRLTTFSRPSIYRLVRAGAFPPPVRLGASKIAFKTEEVQRWFHDLPRSIAPLRPSLRNRGPTFP